MQQYSAKLPGFLHNSFRDAIFYSLMVGMGESYLVAFALSVGVGEMQAGLISVVPVLIGAVLQLFSGYGIRYVNSRKRWICLCAMLQSASLILLAQIPRWKLQSTELTVVIFSLATLYWSSALSAGPCWNVWIGKIVPQDSRLQFFSSRTRVAQLCVLIGLVISGLTLDYSRKTTDYLFYFSSLFMIAGVLRLLSAFFIFVQDDLHIAQDSLRVKGTRILARGGDIIKRPRILKMVTYLFLLNLAAQTSAPFFSPYMLKQLELDFSQYTILISTSFLARVFANDIFVLLAKSHGVKALLYTGMIGIAPLPILWTFSDAFVYLIFLQVLSGFAWGSHELGVTLVLFEKHSEKERSTILTLANLFNSTGMFAGGLIGAQILAHGGVSYQAYHVVFVVSTLARLVPLAILFMMDHVPVPVRDVYLRILSVRVGGGSIVKPILYTEQPTTDTDK